MGGMARLHPRRGWTSSQLWRMHLLDTASNRCCLGGTPRPSCIPQAFQMLHSHHNTADCYGRSTWVRPSTCSGSSQNPCCTLWDGICTRLRHSIALWRDQILGCPECNLSFHSTAFSLATAWAAVMGTALGNCHGRYCAGGPETPRKLNSGRGRDTTLDAV